MILRYTTADLLWWPAGFLVHFVVGMHHRQGTIQLMSTDLTLPPLDVIKLYGLPEFLVDTRNAATFKNPSSKESTCKEPKGCNWWRKTLEEFGTLKNHSYLPKNNWEILLKPTSLSFMRHLIKIFLCCLLYNGMELYSSEAQACPIQSAAIQNQDFQTTFPSDSRISFNPQWGTVRLLQSANLTRDLEPSKEFQTLQVTNQYKEIVFQFLNAYRVPFKLSTPLEELVVHSIQTDDLGFTQVRLRQMVMGIPVWGAEILVQLDHSNHVNLVHGHYYPSPQGLNLHPQLTAEAARKYVASHLSLPDSSCPACPTSLVVFFILEGHSSRLAYSVRTPIGLVEGWNLIVDAETGDILQKIPTVFTQ